jgi:hypothetical protein
MGWDVQVRIAYFAGMNLEETTELMFLAKTYELWNLLKVPSPSLLPSHLFLIIPIRPLAASELLTLR